jgi:dolichol-phosphate mannosyltransferase
MISIILPVKDEPYLPTLLSELQATIKQSYEVLIQTEKGLGYAVKCGIEKAQGEIIVIMDSDGSHPVSPLPVMIEYAKTYDVVIGSRYKGGLTYDSLSRKIISRVYCKFAQTLFGLYIKDNMSGFIAAKKEVFQKYPIENQGYKFGLELLVKSKKDLRAIEYPIVFSKRQMGKSKASAKEAWHTLVFMLKLKAKHKY